MHKLVRKGAWNITFCRKNYNGTKKNPATSACNSRGKFQLCWVHPPSESFCGFFNIFQVTINLTSLCRERSALHDESMVFSRYMIQAMTPFSLTKKVAVIFPSRLFPAFIKNYFQKWWCLVSWLFYEGIKVAALGRLSSGAKWWK